MKRPPSSDLEDGELLDFGDKSADMCGSGALQCSVSDQEESYQLVRSVLPVAPMDESFDPHLEPQTGEDFLRLVRYQYSQLPAVRVAPQSEGEIFPPCKQPIDQELCAWLESTPPENFTNDVWRENFMKTFLEGCLPFDNDEEAFIQLEGLPDPSNKEGWEKILAEVHPDSIKLSLNQLQLLRIVKLLCQTISKIKAIPENVYIWSIRLLQSLDTRRTSSQISVLREFGKSCIRLRSLDAEGADLFYLNAVITVVRERFGQKDLY